MAESRNRRTGIGITRALWEPGLRTPAWERLWTALFTGVLVEQPSIRAAFTTDDFDCQDENSLEPAAVAASS
jgi:hypothetical protein